jgi:flagellar hook assembly protein FlgD
MSSSQNNPNPFRHGTRISFTTRRGGEVQLTIFDVGGRVARKLLEGQRAPGEYSETWDGRRDDGAAAPPGVYFYRLRSDGATGAHKMVLLR